MYATDDAFSDDSAIAFRITNFVLQGKRSFYLNVLIFINKILKKQINTIYFSKQDKQSFRK
jgi:hypothetical protein